MSVFVYMFIALIAVTMVAMVSNHRSIRIMAVLLLFGFQIFILFISFDGAARSVITHGNEAQPTSTEFEAGVRALKDALIPYRLLLLASGAAIAMLVLSPRRLG